MILTRNPETYGRVIQRSPEDHLLGFSIGMSEHDALFLELGANWKEFQHNGGTRPILPDYPLLSRLNDISEDAAYKQNEIDALLAEYIQAQKVVINPAAIRGLDKLIRIARWAQKIGSGIYFVGE